jgi:acyl carrier protein
MERESGVPSHTGPSSNTDEIFEGIRQILIALRVPPEAIRMDAHLAQMGLDSLDQITLAMEVSDYFGVDIQDNAHQIQTVQDGVGLVASLKGRLPRTGSVDHAE